MTEIKELSINTAQVDLDNLHKALSEDAGPLVITLAINRLNGKASIAQGQFVSGREIDELNLLISGLEQVVKLAYGALREATRAEGAKANGSAAPTAVPAAVDAGAEVAVAKVGRRRRRTQSVV